MIFLYEEVIKLKELIGKSAAELIGEIAVKVQTSQGLTIREFSFVQYRPKLHENPNQIRAIKEPGDEVFFRLTPDQIMADRLQSEIKAAHKHSNILGFNSTVIVEPFREFDSPIFCHLLLLDIVLPPSPENISILKKQLRERLGLNSGAIVASSLGGMHFYGTELLSVSDWLAYLGQSLLMNHQEHGEQIIDERHIGHSIIPFPYMEERNPIHSQPLNLALFSTLRISSLPSKPLPYVIDVLD